MEYWEHNNIKKLFIVYLKLKFNWYPMFLFAQSGQPTSISLQKNLPQTARLHAP